MDDNILEVRDLRTYFYTNEGILKAVDGVSFGMRKGEVFGLVGESGSGKTLLGLSILGLVPYPGRMECGDIRFLGLDLARIGEARLREIRGSKISMVFQEPASALNPVFTIGYQLIEAVLAHQQVTRDKARGLALEFLDSVRIPDPKKVFGDYPHQLSGGEKQRAMIAMALINSPELVILDEPTTALDATVQAQILDLMQELIERMKLSVLFISHDFGIISRMCDKVAVMRKGHIVETGSKREVLSSPKDSYTVSLLESVKVLA